MNENLSKQILEQLKQNGQYHYSEASSTRSLEIQAVDELEQTGYIHVTARAIGMVIANVL